MDGSFLNANSRPNFGKAAPIRIFISRHALTHFRGMAEWIPGDSG